MMPSPAGLPLLMPTSEPLHLVSRPRLAVALMPSAGTVTVSSLARVCRSPAADLEPGQQASGLPVVVIASAGNGSTCQGRTAPSWPAPGRFPAADGGLGPVRLVRRPGACPWW